MSGVGKSEEKSEDLCLDGIQEGDVIQVLDFRMNNNNARYPREYKVLRQGRRMSRWECMEKVLSIDLDFPMSLHCSNEHILKYHNALISNNLSLVREFQISAIVDEKQDEDGNFLFKVEWVDWPHVYDSWETYENCRMNGMDCVSQFRRKRKYSFENVKKFDENYWNKNYSKEWQPYLDGITNGVDHSDYAYSFLKKFGIVDSIESIADFGFGMGNILNGFVKKFEPKRVYGLEASPPAYHFFIKKTNYLKEKYFLNCHLHIECIDLACYVEREKAYDSEISQKIEIKKLEKKAKTKRKQRKNQIKKSKRKRKYNKSQSNSKSKSKSKSNSTMSAMSAMSAMSTKSKHKSKEGKEKSNDGNDGNDSDIDMCNSNGNDRHFNESNDKSKRIESNDMSNEMSNEMSEMSSIAKWMQRMKNNNYQQYCHCGIKSNKQFKPELTFNHQYGVATHTNFKCYCDDKFDGCFNLGIFVGVAMYLDDETLEQALDYFHRSCEFLYFNVVTKEEYDIMLNGSTFVDQYAIHRTAKEYQIMVTKYFRIVSNCMLESKWFFNANDTNFPNAFFTIETVTSDHIQ